MKLIVTNPSIDTLEKSYLALAYQKNVTAIKVRNNEKFAINKKILIGSLGNERTEIGTVTGAVTPGTDLAIASTVFPHEADDPVYVLKYDKIRIYRSTTGVEGAYDYLDIVTVDVDNAILTTTYDDVNGLSSYYYKFSFYDSVGDIESQLSDPIAATGYPRGTVGALINEFFEEVGDQTQQNMSVQEALNLMNEVNDDVITQSRKPYRWLRAKAVLDTEIANPRIPLPEDLYKVDRIGYTAVDGIYSRTDNYRIISMEEMESMDNNYLIGYTDDLQYVALDEVTNEIVLFPVPLTTRVGSILLNYWAKFREIKNMNQVIQMPNTRIYKLFLMGRFYRKRAIKEPNFIGISDRFLNDYTSEIVKLQRVSRLDGGSQMGMKPDTRHSRGLRRF